MITIAVANQKGGVGKTTTAIAIGQQLTQCGYTVLYTDMDMQGNLSDTLQGTTGPGIMEVLTKEVPIEKAIRQTALEPPVSLLCASVSLAGADIVLQQRGKEYRLKQALQAVSDRFDYCIIDTPPALGIATINALCAADKLIIPAKADYYSLKGLGQLQATVEAVKAHSNPGLKVQGILITEHETRSVISRDMAQLLEDTAKAMGTKVFGAKIRKCTAVKEAEALKQSIFTYAPRSNAAIDYANLVKEIVSNG